MSEILVDDYTRRGLLNHLQSYENRALCAHEEMSALFDTIQKRQLELSDERQLYCRLYDAGKWTNITGIFAVCFALYTPYNEILVPQATKDKRGSNNLTKFAFVLPASYNL